MLPDAPVLAAPDFFEFRITEDMTNENPVVYEKK
jgi:hypothetical protein